MKNKIVNENFIDIEKNIFKEIRKKSIPVGISSRHIHLNLEDFKKLFPGNDLTVMKPLHQVGHFAAEETVTIHGPKGKIERIRVLGPLRSYTQVELSMTDARILGISAPLRASGHLENTPGVKIESEFGELILKSGVIVALRHIHMSVLESQVYDVNDGDTVKVSIEGSLRKIIFDDVLIRVDPNQRLEMHIDTDEANASDISNPEAYALII